MHVKDAMHVNVTCVAPTTLVPEIAKKMQAFDIGAVPVEEENRLVGMITDRDITCRAVANGLDLSTVTARDIMTPEVTYCREDEDIEDAAHIMEEREIRRLPVLNEDDRVVGMVSLGDLTHATSQELSGEVIKAVTAHHKGD
ncbi:MAG: CBS domain-containing protein [Hyphomicrobiales bacterium]|nr:CBS domain-containing protein [Hyphomicrobiales bacterium]